MNFLIAQYPSLRVVAVYLGGQFTKFGQCFSIQVIDLQLIFKSLDIGLFSLPVQPVRVGDGFHGHRVKDVLQVCRQILIPPKVHDQGVRAGRIVTDGHILLDFKNMVIPDIRWWIVLTIEYAGFQGTVNIRSGHFLWAGTECLCSQQINFLRRNAHFQTGKIGCGSNRPHIVRMRPESLADPGSRYMETVLSRPFIDAFCQFAVNQS